jgi:hypothetical protein
MIGQQVMFGDEVLDCVIDSAYVADMDGNPL